MGDGETADTTETPVHVTAETPVRVTAETPVRVTADRDLCIGAGQCVLAAPEIFDQDDDGLVVVVDGTPPESRLDEADEAALMCPARAISVTDS